MLHKLHIDGLMPIEIYLVLIAFKYTPPFPTEVVASAPVLLLPDFQI